MKKILAINGSLRADSWNGKLLRAFVEQLQGFETRLWPSLEMPLMNEDLEKAPLDSRILDFRAALKASEIVVVASPEYNAGFTPALKNAIDWATRGGENLWAGKIAVILSASPGALGGVRGAIMLRTVLSGCKAWVIPEQVMCPSVHTAFSPEGKLTNEQVRKQFAPAIESLRALSDKLQK